MMTEKQDKENQKDNRKTTEDNDIRFLKEKRRGGPNVIFMAVLLLAVSFAVTLVIVVNSRRWVHVGAAR